MLRVKSNRKLMHYVQQFESDPKFIVGNDFVAEFNIWANAYEPTTIDIYQEGDTSNWGKFFTEKDETYDELRYRILKWKWTINTDKTLKEFLSDIFRKDNYIHEDDYSLYIEQI